MRSQNAKPFIPSMWRSVTTTSKSCSSSSVSASAAEVFQLTTNPRRVIAFVSVSAML